MTEPQFQRYAPAGVQVHVTRLRMTGPNHAPLRELLPRIEEAALGLADAKCDAIVFHCTGSSMEAGLEAEQLVIEAIHAATRRTATTTATALLQAFRALDVRRLVLISPYIQETNDHEVEFLAQAGISVLGDRAMNLGSSDAYIAATPSFWLQTARDSANPAAEAYFLSCTNIRSLDILEDLERELERPAIASNQATLWYCLRRCGLDDVVPGLGRLMMLPLPAAVAA